MIVRAASRLHFGMFGFGPELPRQFGGVGMMIEAPALVVQITAGASSKKLNPLEDRASEFASRAARFFQLDPDASFAIEVAASPRQHQGLGLGTQLGLAVAAGIAELTGRGPLAPEVLARAVGRAARSSVGAYGFCQGGLIVDSGHALGDDVGELAGRFEVPDEWRLLLITPQQAEGLAGAAELAAFAALPDTPLAVAAELQTIATEGIIPALKARNCVAFGDNVYEFGRLSGECFSAVQGGPFASPEIEQLVDWLRANGVHGCGQSSWGPTVYAILPNLATAERIAGELRAAQLFADYEVQLAAPCNHGAQIS